MKNFFLISLLTILLSGCSKEFNLQNPDVKDFVQQLKNGNYNCYEIGENGEKLWLQMPQFTENHVQSLLDFARDTAHLSQFPVNPFSSRRPFPEGREYFILGECLLWTVEGIRNGHGYGSLDPILIDTTKSIPERFKGLTGAGILTVRDLYTDWWTQYKNSNWQDVNPLEPSPFRWH